MEESNINKRLTKTELEDLLLQNFVNLQKVLTNLSIKLDSLSENITKLLQLFEISAKSFAEKQASGNMDMDNEFLSKLDNLLDQNKTIAKGLTLIEGRLRENTYNPKSPSERTETRRPGYPDYRSY